MKMHRTQICLTNIQYDSLTNISNKLEISLAEYLRRIIDKHLKELENYLLIQKKDSKISY